MTTDEKQLQAESAALRAKVKNRILDALTEHFRKQAEKRSEPETRRKRRARR